MPRRDQKGWERGRQMRKWRDRRGGRKPKHEPYLKTRLGLLVDDWLTDQRRRGLTRSTVETRRLLLRRFLQWCAMKNVNDPKWLSPGLLLSWIEWLDDYRTCKQKPLAVMGEPEVAALLVAPDTNDLLGIRDRAMLELLYSSGLRRAELAFMQMGDLRIGSGTLIVRHGKGGKERIVPVGRVATFWLNRYLGEVRPAMLVEDAPSDYVFLTCFGAIPAIQPKKRNISLSRANFMSCKMA